jgi:hypothetical protein
VVGGGGTLVGAVNGSRALDLLTGPPGSPRTSRAGRRCVADGFGEERGGLAMGNWAAFAIGVSGLLLLKMFLLQF